MSVKPSPGRRRVQISDSDDDELVIQNNNAEQNVVEDSFNDVTENRSQTPIHDSSKASSILTSTPRSSSKVSSFIFPEDDNISAIMSESMENISIQQSQNSGSSSGSPSIVSDKWEGSSNDRSRSIIDSPEKIDVMSPISKKLSELGDKASGQKLRERLLRKSVQAKKMGNSRDLDPTARRAADPQSVDMSNSSINEEFNISSDNSAMSVMSGRKLSPMKDSFDSEEIRSHNSLEGPLTIESGDSEQEDEDWQSLPYSGKGESDFVEKVDSSIQSIEKSSGSVICLSSDSEDEAEAVNDSVQVLSSGEESTELSSKENESPTPSDYLLVKYCNDSNDQLHNKLRLVKHTLATIPGSSMKDGGEKLRQQVADLTCLINYREGSQSSGTNLPIVKPVVNRGPQVIEPPVAQFSEDVYDRLFTNDNKRLFGGKMTDNRLDRVERVTENALKGMHTAISSVPEEHHIIESPAGLKIDLMHHQKQGLAWLTWRENQRPPCGILADDMGLGKTLSMISLVLHAKNQLQKKKDEGDLDEYKKRRHAAEKNGYVPSNATLVVAPASLIYQWEQEVHRRVQDGRLRVAIFHGPKNKRESDPFRLARNDIVITTYTLLANELTEKITTRNNEEKPSSDDDDDDSDNWGDQAVVTKEKRKNKISKNSNSVLAKICWARIILDEAHQIKNKNTSASKAVCRLASTARWCLTGTPIHNNLWDMYSLIRFMRVSPFDEERHWKEYIMSSTKKAADRLNLLVKNLLLRRTKAQTNALTNKPLVDLQPKVFKKHELLLQGLEAQVYDIMFTATQQKVKQMLSETDNQRHTQLYGFARKKADRGQEMKNPFNFGPRTIGAGDKFQQMSGMLVMLLRLRQACVHMHLTKEAVDMDAFEHLGGEEKDADDLLEQTMANLTLDDGNGREISTSEIFERDYMSCKVKKLMEIVEDVMNQEEKIVIVSQWTSLLDIVEKKIKDMSIRYTSITGKVVPADRQERVDSFNKERGGASVMLLSLTAGGVGLNLVGGNHLVMVDLHWNPALEAQACDRIYRMGQKKTVYIHRLIVSGTIEQRVADLQEKKLLLANSVLEGAASRKMNKLTMADLRYLFDLNTKKDVPEIP